MLLGRIVFKGQNRTIRHSCWYLNPHENNCSKVISILITGNILHVSSSAPQQHKSVQHKLFAFYLHRDVLQTDMLQPHLISCRGVSGAGGNMRGTRNFCQFYLVLSLFYSLKRGSNGFIAEKTILILYQGSRGGPLYSGEVGVQLFPGGGPNANYNRNPYTNLLFSRGGGCPDPLSPSGSAHGQCHHNGTIFITVRLLTIIVRHLFVRINDGWGFPNDSLILLTFDTFEKHSSWKW